MAVYTHISEEQLRAFLAPYDVGDLVSFEGIQGGIENTNYHVFTDRGRYVLTIFERRVDPADLPFFFDFTRHLSDRGIICPEAIPCQDGKVMHEICGKIGTLISFLDGSEPKDITPEICREMGAGLARMHLASSDFEQTRENSMGLEAWEFLYWKVQDHLEGMEPGFSVSVAGELDYLERKWPKDLPGGVIHGDAFPDNVFFKDESFYGVIDFYFSCEAEYMYDFALVVNAWCFNQYCEMDNDRLGAMVEGYESVRPLSEEEKEASVFMGRAAAVRILMTRLHDWFRTPEDALVQPKDPMEYVAKLNYYRVRNRISVAA